jgi:hypothetical protein
MKSKETPKVEEVLHLYAYTAEEELLQFFENKSNTERRTFILNFADQEMELPYPALKTLREMIDKIPPPQVIEFP